MAVIYRIFMLFILIFFASIIGYNQYKKYSEKSQQIIEGADQMAQIIENQEIMGDDSIVIQKIEKSEPLPIDIKPKSETPNELIMLNKLSVYILKSKFSQAREYIAKIKDEDSLKEYKYDLDNISKLIEENDNRYELVFPKENTYYSWMKKFISVEKVKPVDINTNQIVADLIEKYTDRLNEQTN
jgi:hypothetical protein